jgi:hypothetical protein
MNTNISRRKFLKLSTAAAVAASTGLGVYTKEAQAFGTSIVQLLSVDPATLEYKVFSSCCWYCPKYLIVSHYQPVVLIEVVKGGGDSVIGNPIGGINSVGVDENDYTSMAVRIWELPDWAVDMAMAYQGCKMCGVNSARSFAYVNPLSAGVCGTASDALMKQATQQATSLLPRCFPRLLYTTETDPTWNTGCRDIMKSSLLGPLQCNLFTSMFQIPGNETCIGTKWGPLYPRQMATHEDHGAIAAGIAAYRALHLSRFAAGMLPFDASISVGKLQQTSPMRTVGFGAGSLALDTQMRLGPVSLASTYSFVWWVPVVCCKRYDEIVGLCTPQMPCL